MTTTLALANIVSLVPTGAGKRRQPVLASDLDEEPAGPASAPALPWKESRRGNLSAPTGVSAAGTHVGGEYGSDKSLGDCQRRR
jgi:hypothetical protein